MRTAHDIADLQAQMRRDADGYLVCERCGAPVTRGWTYIVGAIVLATCDHHRCQPPPPWEHCVWFTRPRKRRHPVPRLMPGARRRHARFRKAAAPRQEED